MEYIVEGKTYIMSYSELRERYIQHLEMTDEEFMKNLPSALHLACIICFLKEIPTYVALSDRGVVHQLVHLLHLGETPLDSIKDVREVFKNQLLLA